VLASSSVERAEHKPQRKKEEKGRILIPDFLNA
jgi:hypothetical protein